MYSKQTSDIMLLQPVYSYFIKILCGAWGRLSYHSNGVRNVFGCILQCSICVLTQLVTSQLLLNQQFIFCTFLQITSELKELIYYSKRPISLLFHALSHKTIKNFIANVLFKGQDKTKMELSLRDIVSISASICWTTTTLRIVCTLQCLYRDSQLFLSLNCNCIITDNFDLGLDKS